MYVDLDWLLEMAIFVLDVLSFAWDALFRDWTIGAIKILLSLLIPALTF